MHKIWGLVKFFIKGRAASFKDMKAMGNFLTKKASEKNSVIIILQLDSTIVCVCVRFWGGGGSLLTCGPYFLTFL